MFNKELLLFAKKVEVDENALTFVASNDGSEINFFTDVDPTIHSPEFYTVFVNGKKTEQVFTSLTFAEGDEVKVTCSRNEGFPRFFAGGNDYISSVSVLPYMSNYQGYPIGSFNGAFRDCSSLTSIPTGLFDNNTEVTHFTSAFKGCTGLTSIPQDLFEHNTTVTSFIYLFRDCSSLTSIPTGLFDNNTEVTNFVEAFSGCTGLTSIPTGLFDNNTKVTGFDRVFDGCSNLTSIPTGLFDNNTTVTSFTSAFKGCTGLTSIPQDLFEHNTEVTNFNSTFYNCKQLSGRVKIGSTKVTKASLFCYGTGAMTVIVPAGSTTETTFRAYAETVSNLTVETFEP